MQRAVVLVGVSRTGAGLPALQAVESGVNLMAGWARAQGIPDDLVIRITDIDGPVEVKTVSSAVRKLVDMASLEQLIVYFSGHGVNVGYNEYWLLSDAPDDVSEAVNVRGSADLAEYCGIPHVVLISDACRTPAAGVVAQAVTGTPIFPNRGSGSDAAAVDVFYACSLGRPAFEVEVADPQAPTRYTATYTETVVDALQGNALDLLQPDENPERGCVWPAPLKQYLKSAVPARLHELGVPITAWQVPDARVSADGRWLSQLALDALPPPNRSVEMTGPFLPLESLTEEFVDEVLTGRRGWGWNEPITKSRNPDRLPGYGYVIAPPDRPSDDNWETSAGFAVEGLAVVDVYAPSCDADLIDRGHAVRMDHREDHPSHAVLEFDNGSLVMLPVIEDFIGRLRFENDELVDVSYEPASQTPRRHSYDDRLQELRRLRSTIAAATKQGAFHLEDELSADALARQMQVHKSFDPSLALYATYAYYDLGRRGRDRLEEMRRALSSDLGVVWFDLAMLTSARAFRDTEEQDRALISPLYPALSQGWALATARQMGDQALLARLSPHLVPSPWSVFAAPARQYLHKAMTRMEDR
jgi:hypothetical protein